MGTFDPQGPEKNPNLYDRNKYSAVLDDPSAPIYPQQGYGGMPQQGYGGMPSRGLGGMPPQGLGGMPPQGLGGMPPQGLGGMPKQSFGGMMQQGYGGMPKRAVDNWDPRQVTSKGIAATIQELERMRQSINSRQIFAFIIMALAFISPLFFTMSARRAASGAGMIIMFIGMMISIGFFAGIPKTKKRMKALYKETFVRQMLQEHFQDVYYNWEQGMEQELIKNSGVCRLGNRYSSEDYVSAVYRGIRFQQADVTIQYHTSSGKSSHTTTYFQGRMFCFQYPGKWSDAVQIHSKNFIYAGSPASGVQRSALQMESVDFNKQFTVHAMMEHDAFYILTPQMMERITALKQRYGSITMTFAHGYLMVGLNSKMDSFDADMKKPIDYQMEKSRMNQDVHVIEELIQILQCIPN